MEKAAPSTGQEDLVAGSLPLQKLKGSAREIIRSLEVSDDTPSQHRDGTSHNFYPEPHRTFAHPCIVLSLCFFTRYSHGGENMDLLLKHWAQDSLWKQQASPSLPQPAPPP